MKKKGKTFLSRAAAGLSSAAVALTFTLQTGAGVSAAAAGSELTEEELTALEEQAWANADVDNDGALTPIDVLLILEYVTGYSDQIELVVSENATLAGDFNCDNKVDITDAVGVSEWLGNSSTFSELLSPSATEIAYDLDMSNVYLESGRDSYAEGTITFEVPDTNAKCVALHGKLTLDGYDLGDMGFELVELAIQHVESFDDYRDRDRVTFVPNYETGEFSVIIPNDGSASVTFSFELECQAPTDGAYYDLCLDADIATATKITSTQVTKALYVWDIATTGPEPTEPVSTETEPTEATGSAPTDPPEDAPVTFKEQAQVNGDVDMDCCLSMLDVYGIMRYAAGVISQADFPLNTGGVGGDSSISYTVSEQALENVYFGDFNCDGVVNTADAAALCQYIEQGDAVLDAIEDPSDDEEPTPVEYYLPDSVVDRDHKDYTWVNIDFNVPQTDDYVAIEGRLYIDGRYFEDTGFEVIGTDWADQDRDTVSGLFVFNEYTGEFSWIVQSDEPLMTELSLAMYYNDEEYDAIIDGKVFDFSMYAAVMNAAGQEAYCENYMSGSLVVPPIEFYEPDPTEPDPTEPDTTEPEPTETEATEATEPAPTEPEPTEPAPTETEPTEATEPAPTEPAPTEPAPTETEPTEATEPEPTEPAPTEPAPETTPYSEEQLIEWAINDYETRNGAAPADAQLTENEDDTVSIVLTDAEGAILETYVIDPVTGEGVFGDGTYVTLPQTGRYDMTNYYIAFGALLCVGMGLFLVIRSGLLRKKREN